MQVSGFCDAMRQALHGGGISQQNFGKNWVRFPGQVTGKRHEIVAWE
jgi:hypothetical protein